MVDAVSDEGDERARALVVPAELALEAPAVDFVREAARYLESPSFAIRVADLAGRPVEVLLRRVPEGVRDPVAQAVRGSLERGLVWVVRDPDPERAARDALRDLEEAGRQARRQGRRHALATAATGAASGFVGAAALPVELPVTTLLMLRSIARVAEEMGADLSDPAVRLECLSVFSLGGPSHADDATDSAYLAARVGLHRAIDQAARYVSQHGVRQILDQGSRQLPPVLARLVSSIAARFQGAVAEKVAAQAVPVLGALGGAAINSAFTGHFNSVARYHFGLRRLEARHGTAALERAYREAAGLRPLPEGGSE